MKKTIKNWIEQKSQQRKEKEKQLLKDSIIQHLLLDLTTEETLEIEEYVSIKLREILTDRLEKITKEKQQIENWLIGNKE